MFGYVAANREKLNEDQEKYYKACYCGLCRTLGKEHGAKSRITLNYDMTFLVLILSSVYNIKVVEKGQERCVAHPLDKHDYWYNDITKYASDMNILLTYFNFLDDWEDDRSLLALGEAKVYHKEFEKVEKKYPEKTKLIKGKLKELSLIEKRGETNPDIPAESFGEILGEVFAYKKDEHESKLRDFGKALGKFIYIMDAVMDFKDDLKKERYNPLITVPSNMFKDILNILMADCTEVYESLNVVKDKELIENILYSGVWMKYELKKAKEKEKNHERSL
jgi:hypothetical protein